MTKEFPFKPRVGGWEVTLRCNMNCVHCGSSAGPARPDEMTEQEGLSLIEQLVELGMEEMTLSGGEPLLHPSWQVYAKKLVEGGVRTGLITNGLLLEENIDKLLSAGIRRVGLSMDGTEKTHNFIRNHPNSFKISIKAAKKATEAGLSVAAVTHISRLNIKDMEEMYNILSDVPVGSWQIQIVFKQGRMKENEQFALEPEDLLEIADFIHEKQQIQGGIRVTHGDNMGYYYEPSITKFPWKGCFAGRHVIGIDADGSIKGCLSLPRNMVEGNIRTETLKTIWQDPQRFKYNRYFSPDMMEGYCKDCPKSEPCRGGCTVTAISATGNKFNNPYCCYRLQREVVSREE